MNCLIGCFLRSVKVDARAALCDRTQREQREQREDERNKKLA
jgi:hypothetical protein